VLAAVAAAPAAASAATIAVNKPCYSVGTGSSIVIIGSGFTSGDTIDLNGQEIFATGTVGPAGTFAASTAIPPVALTGPGAKRFTITATSEATNTELASTSFQIASFAVATKPQRAKPHTKVSFSFSGFPARRPIYGHFILHGKLRVTKRYGTATGACGMLKVRSDLYPGSKVRYGTYRVQFDTSKRFRKSNLPRLVTSLRIFRTFHL
jgi:hypothetical protein